MTEPPELPTEPDLVPRRPLRASVAIVIGAIAISVVAVWLLAGRVLHGGGRSNLGVPATERAGLAPPETFSSVTPNEVMRAVQRAQLDGWEWADRTHTRVRVPITIAIDRYVGGAR
jgi:hypothetical protein